MWNDIIIKSKERNTTSFIANRLGTMFVNAARVQPCKVRFKCIPVLEMLATSWHCRRPVALAACLEQAYLWILCSLSATSLEGYEECNYLFSGCIAAMSARQLSRATVTHWQARALSACPMADQNLSHVTVAVHFDFLNVYCVKLRLYDVIEQSWCAPDCTHWGYNRMKTLRLGRCYVGCLTLSTDINEWKMDILQLSLALRVPVCQFADWGMPSHWKAGQTQIQFVSSTRGVQSPR